MFCFANNCQSTIQAESTCVILCVNDARCYVYWILLYKLNQILFISQILLQHRTINIKLNK